MSPQYLSPGVYVEEVDRGPKPIEGVGTAVAAFVGFAEKGPVNEPTLITNWTQFVNTFGGFIKGSYLAHAIYGYYMNGGTICYVTKLPDGLGMADGGTAQVGGVAAVSAGPAVLGLPSKASPGQDSLQFTALDPKGGDITVEVAGPGEGTPEDQFNLTVKRGDVSESFPNVTLGKGKNLHNVVETVNKESKLVKLAEKELPGTPLERMPAAGVYTLTVPGVTALAKASAREVDSSTFVGDVTKRSGINGLEIAEDATMVCVPDLMAAYQAGKISKEGIKAVQLALIAHCENMRDRVAILDCPPGMSPQQVKEWRMKDAGYDSKYAVLYYPWVKVMDPLGGDAGLMVPPCGHMAGVWARSDGERGVHKAPANEVVRGALSLEMQITKGEQDTLNPDGINCIRTFSGRGIRVWGARTLSSDASWRYINVRRLFNMVEKSIERGTQWVVFEPNDQFLWSKIKRDIGSFLWRVWSDGALFGQNPDQAYFVKCDEELNPAAVRDAGQVIIEVGIAPVKPAEFVVFRISQYSPGA